MRSFKKILKSQFFKLWSYIPTKIKVEIIGTRNAVHQGHWTSYIYEPVSQLDKFKCKFSIAPE